MIREYKESDFSAIEKIYNLSKIDEFIGEDFDVIVIPLSSDQKMMDLFNTSKIYIYEVAGVVGFAGVKENYISWLFVHPDFREQDIGKKLVLHILSTLSGGVTLNVARSNFVAKSLYENLGFKVSKEFTGQYQENTRIVCTMSMVVKHD